MALLTTYPLMTISTMQATRHKTPQGAAAALAPLSPSPKGGNGPAPVVQKTQRGAFADIIEARPLDVGRNVVICNRCYM